MIERSIGREIMTEVTTYYLERIEMLSYSCNPKKDDKGQLVIAVITITDITDRINR